jgi:hypothetical protein
MSAPTPATFHLPHSSLEPLELTLKMPSLAMAVVPRDAISALVDKWAKAIGVYVLLGPSDDDEHDYRAYAGQSAPAMRRRLTGGGRGARDFRRLARLRLPRRARCRLRRRLARVFARATIGG